MNLTIIILHQIIDSTPKKLGTWRQKLKNHHLRNVTLVLDAISIRAEAAYDVAKDEYSGFINYEVNYILETSNQFWDIRKPFDVFKNSLSSVLSRYSRGMER
ncbi:uncharacterized protein LOC124292772 [Neodiprion lecontei]|uniref:Uncharacterized protein LOC124292772 n=1 Tax=Neodiprion lecontei TaxID=441921 RepID=A0ABM3FF10_NEOLC|nr:uncharacterized protein LOC124292772 [Neodiprion lecontei]